MRKAFPGRPGTRQQEQQGNQMGDRPPGAESIGDPPGKIQRSHRAGSQQHQPGRPSIKKRHLAVALRFWNSNYAIAAMAAFKVALGRITASSLARSGW